MKECFFIGNNLGEFDEFLYNLYDGDEIDEEPYELFEEEISKIIKENNLDLLDYGQSGSDNYESGYIYIKDSYHSVEWCEIVRIESLE